MDNCMTMTEYDKFIIARWMYSIGEPIMEDSEYTLLHNTIKRTHPDSPYLTRSWSSDPCPVQLLRDYGYDDAIRDIVLSDKTESIPSINDWGALRGVYRDLNEEVTVSYKHDGWNIQAAYYNGELLKLQTRGRSTDAMSVEMLKQSIPQTIPQLGRVVVCFEATISNTGYKYLSSRIKVRSQRGAVSTCLAHREYVGLLTLHAHSTIGDYQVANPLPELKEWGFNTVQWTTAHNYDELVEAMEYMDREVDKLDIPTDGLVIRGTMSRAVRLLHWEEPIYRSYVTGYEETFGAYRVGVKAEIRPIAMKNSTQTVVSCTNYQTIIENNLRIGYPIAFKLSSMAIAVLDSEATRLLQEEWNGREREYCAMVDEGEDAKREKMHTDSTGADTPVTQ